MGERIDLKTVAGWVTLGATCIALVFWLGIVVILLPIVYVMRLWYE